MGKVFIEETTLTGIADAIRGKNGTTALIATTDMADAITNLPTGGGNIVFPTEIWISNTINKNGDFDWIWKRVSSILIHTNYGSSSMSGGDLEDYSNITVYFGENLSSGGAASFLQDCHKITKLPNIYFKVGNNLSSTASFFYQCQRLKEIPENFFMTTDDNNESTGVLCFNTTSTRLSQAFGYCYSLRKIPKLGDGTQRKIYNGNSYTNTFAYCYVLDEVTNLPVSNYNFSSNQFNQTFAKCYRLKKMQFEFTNGTYGNFNATWSNQTIDLSGVGYFSDGDESTMQMYNNDEFTEANRVTDDVSYQALKDTEDWWTTDIRYSRYNKTSAYETILSLPKIANTAANNTIKFTGAAGELTDGGAINTLTDSQIAAATAKGWTVSLV